MSGLNFSTTTIINAKPEGGLNDVVKVVYPRKKSGSVWVDDTESDMKKIRLGKGVDLVAKYIKSYVKTEGYGPEMCKAVLDLAGLAEGFYRLDVHLGANGAEPLIFAAPAPQNGTPFWIEFTVTASNKTTIAAEIVKIINANKLFVLGDNLISASGTSTSLTLEGNTEYLRFRKLELYKYSVDENGVDHTDRVKVFEPSVLGKNGFGTYSHIIKDLRLPTAANTTHNHLREDETPNVGTTYTQYVFEYEAPSQIRGTQVVGSVNHSHTQHVAWVASSIVSAFDSLLTNAGIASEASGASEGELDD